MQGMIVVLKIGRNEALLVDYVLLHYVQDSLIK